MAFCRHTGTPWSWPDLQPPPSKRPAGLQNASSSAQPPTSCSTAGIITPCISFLRARGKRRPITSTSPQLALSPLAKKNQNTPELGAALRAGVCPSQHQCGSPSMLQAAHGQFQQQIYILCKPLQGISVDMWGFLYIFFAIIIFLVKTSSSCAPQ